MTKWRVFSYLAAVFMAVSCAQSPQQQREVSPLLRTVPSDALVVMDFDRCSDVFAFMPDSTCAIARLELGHLKNARCVLSYVYSGRLEPVLSIDAGRAPADTTDSILSLVAQADTLGLHARFFPNGWAEGERSAIIITRADATMPAVMRHIEGLTSIYDAPMFKEATQKAGNSRGTIYLRNSGLDKSIPKSFLKGFVGRTELIRFLQKSADWTVFGVNSQKQLDVDVVLGPSMEHYTNAIADLPFAESRLGSILPADTDFAVAQPVVAGFREKFEAYMDASVKLTKYRKRIDELKSACGKSPLAWEKEQDIKEIAFVCRAGSKLMLARPAKAGENTGVLENPFPGFLQSLYGELFAIPDLSFAVLDGWNIYGTDSAVQSFLDCEDRMAEDDWQYRNCHFVVYRPDRRLSWDPKGIRYGVQTTE